ncbi:TetR/AcrR family transcriptional regulator [Frondihabitans cladoniiphilus]|uniref:HTH tetR-type domain-containing protein n=1 Tax=Frondihabitans cladoniiphilus TaxID=715785 RepID=A0ABP8VUI5_9MICO
MQPATTEPAGSTSGAPDRVDPRTQRSVAALREAVLALAAQQEPSAILVTDLVKAAGVSRKTFYNHAVTPVELLIRVLTDELDAARDRAEAQFSMAADDLASAVRRRLTGILQHVSDRRAVYLSPAGDRLSPELFQMLSSRFRNAVELSIAESYRVAPVVSGFDDAAHRAAAIEMSASFVGHAYAGAIQAWLQHPEVGEVDFVLDLIWAALPAWMTERPSSGSGFGRVES